MEWGGGGASRWHMLGFGTWPPFLPSMLQILEMVVGTAAVCSPLPGIAGPGQPRDLCWLALGSLLDLLLVGLDSGGQVGPARS